MRTSEEVMHFGGVVTTCHCVCVVTNPGAPPAPPRGRFRGRFGSVRCKLSHVDCHTDPLTTHNDRHYRIGQTRSSSGSLGQQKSGCLFGRGLGQAFCHNEGWQAIKGGWIDYLCGRASYHENKTDFSSQALVKRGVNSSYPPPLFSLSFATPPQKKREGMALMYRNQPLEACLNVDECNNCMRLLDEDPSIRSFKQVISHNVKGQDIRVSGKEPSLKFMAYLKNNWFTKIDEILYSIISIGVVPLMIYKDETGQRQFSILTRVLGVFGNVYISTSLSGSSYTFTRSEMAQPFFGKRKRGDDDDDPKEKEKEEYVVLTGFGYDPTPKKGALTSIMASLISDVLYKRQLHRATLTGILALVRPPIFYEQSTKDDSDEDEALPKDPSKDSRGRTIRLDTEQQISTILDRSSYMEIPHLADANMFPVPGKLVRHEPPQLNPTWERVNEIFVDIAALAFVIPKDYITSGSRISETSRLQRLVFQGTIKAWKSIISSFFTRLYQIMYGEKDEMEFYVIHHGFESYADAKQQMDDGILTKEELYDITRSSYNFS